MDSVKAVVADTYLSYDLDLAAGQAYDIFTSFIDSSSVRIDLRFRLFTRAELVDEMMLLYDDIIKLFNSSA